MTLVLEGRMSFQCRLYGKIPYIQLVLDIDMDIQALIVGTICIFVNIVATAKGIILYQLRGVAGVLQHPFSYAKTVT